MIKKVILTLLLSLICNTAIAKGAECEVYYPNNEKVLFSLIDTSEDNFWVNTWYSLTTNSYNYRIHLSTSVSKNTVKIKLIPSSSLRGRITKSCT